MRNIFFIFAAVTLLCQACAPDEEHSKYYRDVKATIVQELKQGDQFIGVTLRLCSDTTMFTEFHTDTTPYGIRLFTVGNTHSIKTIGDTVFFDYILKSRFYRRRSDNPNFKTIDTTSHTAVDQNYIDSLFNQNKEE